LTAGAPAPSSLRVPGRLLRTDTVILVAESMGTLTAGSLVQRPARPTGGIWGLEGELVWAFRATCLRRSWTVGCCSRAWRSALPRRQGGRLVGVLSLLAELTEDALLLPSESERTT
jgi:hypothetical protein